MFIGLQGDPKLWYGIGILYDRHNSLNMAEEAFVNVIQHDPSTFSRLPSPVAFVHSWNASLLCTDFEKANEIYFRLGIIYKQKRNSEAAMNCFRYILSNPPRPLSEPDIWFQIGQVFDQQQDVSVKDIHGALNLPSRFPDTSSCPPVNLVPHRKADLRHSADHRHQPRQSASRVGGSLCSSRWPVLQSRQIL